MLTFILLLFGAAFAVGVIFTIYFKIQKKIQADKDWKNYDYKIWQKTIYAKKGKITNAEIKEILQLEITTFKSKNAGFKFYRWDKNLIKNPDRSISYRLLFRRPKLRA